MDGVELHDCCFGSREKGHCFFLLSLQLLCIARANLRRNLKYFFYLKILGDDTGTYLP